MLNAEINKAFNTPAFRDPFVTLGVRFVGGSPEQLESHMRAETRRWAEVSDAPGKVDFIADAHGRFAEALGLAKDFGDLGRRFARFAMIARDGIVEQLFVQDVKGVTVSGAPAILLALQGEAVA